MPAMPRNYDENYDFRTLYSLYFAGTRPTLPDCLEVTCVTFPAAPAEADADGDHVASNGGAASSVAAPQAADLNTGMIQGVRHKTLVVEGVQFHPESVLTEHGHAMLKNFLQWDRAVR